MTTKTTRTRLLYALGGAVSGAALVALAEAEETAAAAAGTHAPAFAALALADLGVLAPVALLAGAAIGAASLFLEPGRPVTPSARIAALRTDRVRPGSQPVPLTAPWTAPPAETLAPRPAALLPLALLATTLWLVVTAQAGRAALARDAPMAAGVALAVMSIANLAGCIALALALLSPLRRALAAASFKWPRAIDPITTTSVALAFAVLVFAAGASIGDTGGDGPTPLSVFGVLRRSELDLRPLADLGVIAVGAWLGSLVAAAAAVRPPWREILRVAPALAGCACAASLAVTVFEAGALNRAPDVALAVESHAPLGRIALALVRKATDRDHDGASPYFGGGDCDDHNPNISPRAVDIPGNGIDEDCSGADLPLPAAGASGTPTAAPAGLAAFHDFNLILITIDTVRAGETGFLGYGKPTTPNLDVLASNSVVFDRAYAMASYTGKALAPMLIGKYPSETRRDGGHFNKYFETNTFLAERLRQAGLYTMGAASHWYFKDSWGLTQGFDTFDLSAMPKSGQGDSDTSVTSPQLTDAAMKLLDAHAGSQRFFMWVHYFDPHEQYVPHPEAPDFADPAKPTGWRMRALYDGEIWFTDKAIGRLLDYVNEKPWGRNTVVVVTSDHGEAMNEHGIAFQHGFEIWEPLMRVPLVIHVPGARPHHVPVKRSAVDIVPTLLDLMGLPRPATSELSGRSMAVDVLAPADGAYEERDVYMDMPDGPYTHMRRGLIHGTTPGMKLIHFGGRQYQLYDLQRDPGETDDLSSDPSRMGPMLEALAAKRATLHEIDVKPDAP